MARLSPPFQIINKKRPFANQIDLQRDVLSCYHPNSCKADALHLISTCKQIISCLARYRERTFKWREPLEYSELIFTTIEHSLSHHPGSLICCWSRYSSLHSISYCIGYLLTGLMIIQLDKLVIDYNISFENEKVNLYSFKWY